MRRRLGMPLSFGLLLLAACYAGTSRRADLLYESGDYVSAAKAYSDSREAPSARDLYRLAVATGLPGSPARDAALARRSLAELSARFPKSPYAEAGRVLLACLDEERRLEGELASSRALLAEARSETQAAIERSDALSSLEAEKQKSMEQLQTRLAEQERALGRLRRELEALKHIDLQK